MSKNKKKEAREKQDHAGRERNTYLKKITYKDVKNSEEVNAYIKKGNETLGRIGLTDHSKHHAIKVAQTASWILSELGFDEHTIELAKIAGYMHDIGNCVNRTDHPHSGAVMAFQILRDMEMPYDDIAVVINAIGQHDESTGTPVDAVSAALILGDKTDVRRNRVRKVNQSSFDKHDRVNYAAIKSELDIDKEKKTIKLSIALDEEICSIMDYFEIFTKRMMMSRRAAEMLGLKFKFSINGNKVC